MPAIHIPPEVIEEKPWFPTLASAEAVLAEIREFTKETGTPYLWRGHTHTAPDRGEQIEFVGDITLPARCHGEHNRHLWSPCPICSPADPKWFRLAMVTWSATKHVIRIIGTECFETIYGEEHEAAAQRYRDRKQLAADTTYLLDRLATVPTALPLIERAIETAKAVDAVRSSLIHRFDSQFPIRIWNQVREGALNLRVERREIYRANDGSERERVVDDFERYGPLPGYIMLQPNPKPIAAALEKLLPNLRSINHGTEPAAAIQRMDVDEAYKTARILRTSLERAQEGFDEITELRRFMSKDALATLRGWGRHERSPLRLYVRLEGREFQYGQSEHNFQRLILPTGFWNELGTLPHLARTTIQ